jgi:DNA-binding response OmpR family regulator
MRDKEIIIYLADDDEDDRMIFEEALSEISGNIKLVKITDGIKLLNQLSEDKTIPDIIFLDLNMPFQSGKETLKILRANRSYSKIPVVIYSTSTNPADIEDTFSAGASLYMEKPYSMCSMVKKIEAIISMDWYSFAGADRKNYFISSKESSSVNLHSI